MKIPEVVTIERNKVIIDRETILENSHIEEIIESGTQTVLIHKDDANQADYASFTIHCAKRPGNSEKAVLYIYRQLRNAEPMTPLQK